jgi:hypothetical protein
VRFETGTGFDCGGRGAASGIFGNTERLAGTVLGFGGWITRCAGCTSVFAIAGNAIGT